MEPIRGLNIEITKCISIISDICNELDIKLNINEESKPVQIKLIKGDSKGLIRIYSSKKGLTLDPTVGADKVLNEMVVKKFLEYKNIKKTENKNFTYKKFDCNKVSQLEDNFHNFTMSEQYSVTKKNYKAEDTKKWMMKIKDNTTNESLVIILHNNRSLQIQGIGWVLWEDVCQVIERTIDISIDEIVSRITLKNKKSVEGVNDFSTYENNIRTLIGSKAYEYIDEDDLNYLISGECLLSKKIKLPNYSAILAPTAIALEGYLKKLLIYFDIEKAIKMKKGNWNFSCVFKPNCKLKDELHSKLSKDEIKKGLQLKALANLCKMMKKYRNNVCHSGPKPSLVVEEFEDCKKRFYDILKIIKLSYIDIF